MSKAHKGKKFSKSHRLALKEAKKNISEETKEKIRKANLGKKLSESTKEKLRARMMGNTYCVGRRSHNVRKVKNIESGEIYPSIREAAEAIGMKQRTLRAMLSGQSRNKTSLERL